MPQSNGRLDDLDPLIALTAERNIISTAISSFVISIDSTSQYTYTAIGDHIGVLL